MEVTYWFGDEETGEEIEERVKCSCKNGGYLLVWCD